MLKKKSFKVLASIIILFVYLIGAVSSGSSAFMDGMYSGAANAYSNPFQPSYNFTMPSTPQFNFTMPSGTTGTPIVTSTPVSSRSSSSTTSSGSSSTSSGTPAQTSREKCGKCKYGNSGWYECPCSNVPTFGTTSYHECANCGAKHMRGSHSCKCKKCGGDGYI